METQTYDEYWLGYLAGHSKLSTRVYHYFGLFFGQVMGIAASITFVWWAFFVIGPTSYLIALVSHEHIEGNSNKPFAARPVWSTVSFFRMLALDMTGNLHKQMARMPQQ